MALRAWGPPASVNQRGREAKGVGRSPRGPGQACLGGPSLKDGLGFLSCSAVTARATHTSGLEGQPIRLPLC